MNHLQYFSFPSFKSRASIFITLPMLEGWLRPTGTWREYKNTIIQKDTKRMLKMWLRSETPGTEGEWQKYKKITQICRRNTDKNTERQKDKKTYAKKQAEIWDTWNGGRVTEIQKDNTNMQKKCKQKYRRTERQRRLMLKRWLRSETPRTEGEWKKYKKTIKKYAKIQTKNTERQKDREDLC